MADFTALKTAIQTYIKQNGNEEITGEKLQEILLSVVTILGDSAINDLITALANEVAARQNADGTLQQNITNEATARGNADTALSNRLGSTITAENTAADQIGAEAEARAAADTALQGLIDGITENIENGYVYAGIATPSSTPATGKVFYLALTAGTYTNFGNTVVSQGINILKFNGSAWSLDAFIGIDDELTPGSNNLPKSGNVLENIIKNGSAFDLSAYNAVDGVLATYADLDAALIALNALPAVYKQGGMSFRFVHTSNNKYVQYRLTKNTWSATLSDWEDINSTGLSFQWRQGYTQGGEDMEFLAESEKEISTYGIPVGLVKKIYVATDYILNVFQYDANGGYITFRRIDGNSLYNDFTPSTETVEFIRFSLREANGGNVAVANGVSLVKIKGLELEVTANSFQWRQGYTQGGENMDFFAASEKEISTYGIPVGLFNRVSVLTDYILNIFEYDANGDYIGYYSITGTSEFVDFTIWTEKVTFVRFSLRKSNGGAITLDEGVTAISVKMADYTGNSFQWRQGYTQGGEDMEFLAESEKEISTYGIPVGLVKKIYVATDYILNVFQYDANGGYIGYYPITGTSEFVDFTIWTEKVVFLRFSLRKANGGDVAVADGVTAVSVKGLELEEQNVPDDNNFIGSYTGDKIVLDANEKRYFRYKFLSVPESNKLNQSMAIFGNYVVLMMDGHSSPFAHLYNINTGENICDLNFQYDSTDYSECHANACTFGVEYYNSQSEFPLFYVSQYVGERAYFVYDFQKQNDNTYIPVLVQIIKPDLTLKNNASFGAGYGDFAIDTEHSIMFHLGYYSEQDWQTPRLTKFTLPGKNDGVTTVLTSGLTVKVVTLTTSDILASALPNINGFQDTTYKNGCLYINGYGAMYLMDVTDYSIKNTIYTTSPLYNEIEGVSFWGNRLMATYWEIEGVHEIYFL